MSDRRSVAIVHLGRGQARGEVQRVACWTRLIEAAGAHAHEVALLPGRRGRAAGAVGALSRLPSVARGHAVPETLAWSWPALDAELRAVAPAAVICVTARAFVPDMARRPWVTVLDYVDRLSESYRDRAGVTTARRSATLLRALAATSARFERRAHPAGVRRVAAGWRDAEVLGAEWVPNVVAVGSPARESASDAASAADHDVLFMGTLRYPPNIEALDRLARLWPAIVDARPGTTALVAGSAPTSRVRALAAARSWTLVADFPDVGAICRRARVSVAPLTFASGIQNKVLDAAAHGVPSVVTPAALAGLRPGFPARVADDDRAFVAAIVELLDDADGRAVLADAARAEVIEEYSATRWAGWVRSLLVDGA